MGNKAIRCSGCGLTPGEIEEYVEFSGYEDMTPEEYVIKYEGTYNPSTGLFLCTECYLESDLGVLIIRD